jgi:hypothetical protein
VGLGELPRSARCAALSSWAPAAAVVSAAGHECTHCSFDKGGPLHSTPQFCHVALMPEQSQAPGGVRLLCMPMRWLIVAVVCAGTLGGVCLPSSRTMHEFERARPGQMPFGVSERS